MSQTGGPGAPSGDQGWGGDHGGFGGRPQPEPGPPPQSSSGVPRWFLAVAAAMVVVIVIAGVGIRSRGSPHANAIATPAPTPAERSKSALQIYTDSKTAFARAASVHISGTVVRASDTVSVDLHETAAGDGTGRVVINGVPVEIMMINGTAYMQGSLFFSELGAPQIGDMWVSTPARAPSMVQFDALFTYLENPDSLLGSSGNLATGDDATVDGSLALTLSDTTTGTVFNIALEGPPFPLRVSSGHTNVIDLDGYGAPLKLTPPADLYGGAAPGATTL